MFPNVQQSIGHLDLSEGMRVADLGSGTGFYAKAASSHVGHTGKVYAVEVQKDLVKKLETDLKEDGVENIDCIWGDIEMLHGTKLADQSVDRVIVSNVLFQAEDKVGLIDEAKRILKPHGKVLLIDRNEFGGMGSSFSRHTVSPDKARDLFERRGFKVAEMISTGDYHYGIIFIHD